MLSFVDTFWNPHLFSSNTENDFQPSLHVGVCVCGWVTFCISFPAQLVADRRTRRIPKTEKTTTTSFFNGRWQKQTKRIERRMPCTNLHAHTHNVKPTFGQTFDLYSFFSIFFLLLTRWLWTFEKWMYLQLFPFFDAFNFQSQNQKTTVGAAFFCFSKIWVSNDTRTHPVSLSVKFTSASGDGVSG